MTPPAESESSSAEAAFQAKETGRFSVSVKRLARRKAESQCEYVSPEGHRCEARHRLEFDHRTPLALGGESQAHNIRVLCREHNILAATKKLGTRLMSQFIPAMR